MLTVMDEYTRECLTVEVTRKFSGRRVVEVLAELFAIRGRPGHIRSDNGPEFASKAVSKWLDTCRVGPLFIELGSPWENGYIESFNGKLEDECLNGELLLNLTEAKYIVDRWRLDYNHYRPHSMLNWQTPAAFTGSRARRDEPSAPCAASGSAAPHPAEHTETTSA